MAYNDDYPLCATDLSASLIEWTVPCAYGEVNAFSLVQSCYGDGSCAGHTAVEYSAAAPLNCSALQPKAEVLHACGSGCLGPKLDPKAVASEPELIEVSFSAPYFDYATPSGSYPMAFGICHSLGCNYRNVTVTFVEGDTVSKQRLVYAVRFFSLPPDQPQWAVDLAKALPSSDKSDQASVVYGMYFTQGGALPTVVSVAPCKTAWKSCLVE